MFDLNNLKNKKIAILGLGVENIALLKFLRKFSSSITICDQKEKSFLLPLIAKIKGNWQWQCGSDYGKNLSDFDYIFRTPGFSLNNSVLKKAQKKGAIISSGIKLFFDLCPCPIIGVTGTKGKGTTSTLIYQILKQAGKKVFLGGNIGLSPLEFLSKLTEKALVVLELSSFQTQDLHRSPHVAVILMTTKEHLDYHKNVREYVLAKGSLVKYQTGKDFLVVNFDYKNSQFIGSLSKGKKYYFSRQKEVFPGLFVDKKKQVVKNFSNKISEILFSTHEIKLPGEHNWENVLAAVGASLCLGVKKEVIRKAVKKFQGLPHRLEFIRNVEGIDFYNDTFSTTPESAIVALKAFSQPKIIILGGHDKGIGFRQLGRVVANEDVRAVILIGDTAEKIKKEILFFDKNKKIKLISGLTKMSEMVDACFSLAKKGEVVLLSPACASFGLFNNYKERGELFKSAVKKL